MASPSMHPFSRNWSAPRAIESELTLGKIRVRSLSLESFCLTQPDVKIQTTASSTRLAHRARIELICKAALTEARAQSDRHLFHTLDPASGDALSALSYNEAFAGSLSVDKGPWQFCLKSGVAVHVDPAAACAAAWNDLVLSDRVLRSWYGGTPPRHWTQLDTLGPSYTTDVYYFLGSTPRDIDPIITVGVFAFAEAEAIRAGLPPILFGFGTSQGKDSALQRAYEKLLALSACLMRPNALGRSPVPSWISSEEGVQTAREWLAGSRADRKAPALLRPVLESEPALDASFVDITPADLLEPVSVVRAASSSRMISALLKDPSLVSDGLLPIPLHPIGVA